MVEIAPVAPDAILLIKVSVMIVVGMSKVRYTRARTVI